MTLHQNQGPGMGHNSGDHQYTAEEIEALHRTGEETVKPRTQREAAKAAALAVKECGIELSSFGLPRARDQVMIRWAEDRTLGHAHRLVLAWLSHHTNTKTGYTFVSFELLAAECGCSAKTIRNTIAELAKAGWIVRTSGNQKNVRGLKGPSYALLAGNGESWEASAERLAATKEAAKKKVAGSGRNVPASGDDEVARDEDNVPDAGDDNVPASGDDVERNVPDAGDDVGQNVPGAGATHRTCEEVEPQREEEPLSGRCEARARKAATTPSREALDVEEVETGKGDGHGTVNASQGAASAVATLDVSALTAGHGDLLANDSYRVGDEPFPASIVEALREVAEAGMKRGHRKAPARVIEFAETIRLVEKAGIPGSAIVTAMRKAVDRCDSDRPIDLIGLAATYVRNLPKFARVDAEKAANIASPRRYQPGDKQLFGHRTKLTLDHDAANRLMDAADREHGKAIVLKGDFQAALNSIEQECNEDHLANEALKLAMFRTYGACGLDMKVSDATLEKARRDAPDVPSAIVVSVLRSFASDPSSAGLEWWRYGVDWSGPILLERAKAHATKIADAPVPHDWISRLQRMWLTDGYATHYSDHMKDVRDILGGDAFETAQNAAFEANPDALVGATVRQFFEFIRAVAMTASDGDDELAEKVFKVLGSTAVWFINEVDLGAA